MLKNIPFYGSLIGKELPNGKLSTTSHVLVYGAIEAHSMGSKGCIASNKLISSETGLKEHSVATIISLLNSANWIETKIDKNNHRKNIIPLLTIVVPPFNPHCTPLQSPLNIEYSNKNTLLRSADESAIVSSTTELPTTNKLFWDVVKKYGLPVTNANNIRKWASDIEKMEDGNLYLERLLKIDLRTMEGDFRPTLNTPFDIISKKLMVQRFWGVEQTVARPDAPVYDPVYEAKMHEWNELEAEAFRQDAQGLLDIETWRKDNPRPQK
jgi:hypothetical protein